MDCLEGRLIACNKRISEELSGKYLNPDTMKYYDYKDGVNTSFNMDDDGVFRNFYIKSRYPGKLRKEKDWFLKMLKEINVEDILGRNWLLEPGKNGWVNFKQEKNKETGSTLCYIYLEVPKAYEEVYQIEKLQEANGIDDILIPKNSKEDKKTLEKIEKLRKLKAQKYFDEHPHLNRVFINVNGNKILYVKTPNGIVRGGDQLRLNFDAPIASNAPMEDSELPPPEDFGEPSSELDDYNLDDFDDLDNYDDLDDYGLDDYDDILDDYDTIDEIPDVTQEDVDELTDPYEGYQEPDMDYNDLDDSLEYEDDEFDLSMSFEDWLDEKGITIDPKDKLENREHREILEQLISTVIKNKKIRMRKISERISSLKKLGKSSTQRIKYQSELKTLQKEVEALEKRRERYLTKPVEQAIIDEINDLEKVVTPTKDANGNIILDNEGNPIYEISIDTDLIVVERFEDRLNNICKFLTGRDINGKYVNTFDNNVVFDEGLKNDSVLVDSIKKLDSIQRAYDKRRAEIILDYAKSDIAKKHFKSEEKRKEFEKVALDFLQHPEKTVDELFRGMFPKALLKIADAEQGLGIFGAILKTYFYEEQRGFERQVKSLFDEIKQLEKNIKDKFKQYTSDIFFRRDELGNRTNRLVNLFTDTWKNSFYYTAMTRQNDYRFRIARDYQTREKQNAFYTFKSQILENAEILQIGEFQEIYDLVAEYDSNNNTNFLSVFFPNGVKNNNTQYEYQKYNKINSAHFNRDVLGKAKQQILSYMDALVIEGKKDDAEFIKNDGRNPFYFAENFATSHEYNKNLNQLWSIDYVTLLPKKEQYYDKNFINNISNNDEIQELWSKYAEIIIDNINTALIENGANISSDEIPVDLNIVKSEMFKNLIFFKRWKIRWENSHKWVEKFYTKNYIREEGENDIKDKININLLSGNTFLKKLKNNLKNYDRNQLEIILNEKGINYKSWEDYLKEYNFNEDELSSKNEKFYQSLQQRYKGYLASLIASQDVLKSASLDMTDNIGKFAESVTMMQARNKTRIFAETILDFLRKNQREKNTNDQDYYNAMSGWTQRNIYGNKQISDTPWAKKAWVGKGKNINTTQNKISGQYTLPTLPQNFHFNGTSYDINITLKDENDEPVKSYNKTKILFKSDINRQLASNEPQTITVDGKTYKVSVNYFKEGKTKVIDRSEYLSAYNDKLKQDEENERLRLTWRSVNDGFASLIAGKALMINPESGVKNRWEGEFTNIRLAAQGIFSYGMRELYAAKRFLNVILLAKSTKLGEETARFLTPEHFGQLKVYELFTKQMSLYQDHTNLDLTDDEKYRFVAFSIDFPETHNQGENILSTLIHNNIKVKDIHGNEHPLFDTEAGLYGAFTIFDENEAVKNGRLKLKPEFDTEENRMLWENWLAYKDNYTSLNLIHDCAINVSRAQGNYEKGDVAGTQNNLFLKDLWQFKKWMFSHLKQRYNDTTIDYRAGTLNNKGLYNVLMENGKALTTFLVIDSLLTISTSPKTLIKGLSLRNLKLAPFRLIMNIVELLAQIGVPFIMIKMYFKNRTQLDKVLSAEEEKINNYWGILLEALGRTFTTAANQASLKVDQYLSVAGRLKGLKGINRKVTNLTEGIYDRTIYNQYKDNEELLRKRRLLSGAAQQLANSIYIYGLVFAINTALNIIIDYMFRPDCDENDPDCEQKNKARLKAKEKSLFFFINLLHNMQDDSRKFHNPFVLYDNMGTASVWEGLKRLAKVWYKMQSEKADAGDKIIYIGKQVPQPFVPNQIVSPIVYGIAAGIDEEYREDFWNLVELPFQDKQIYDLKATDYWLMDRETKTKYWYDSYKTTIDKYTKDYVKSLKESDKAKGIDTEDKDYEKEKKWFRKEFKTKVFGCNSQDEVMATLMDEEDYQDWLKYNSYRAEYYAKYKKYPSEDEIPKRILKKKPQK